jgi:hypothetical protein
MRLGIVAEDEDVAKAWENRLQHHISVREVTIVKKSEHLQLVDACLIIKNNDSIYDDAASLIRRGMHCFLISKLPTHKEQIERLYHFSEESGVFLQLAHWISFSPAAQWINTKIKHPTFIHIDRRLPLSQINAYDHAFSNLWIDDLAYCLKIMRSNVHKVEVGFSGITQPMITQTSPQTPSSLPQLHLFIRFDNGGSALIFIGTGVHELSYKRVISDSKVHIEHDVLKSSVLVNTPDQNQHIFQETKHFLEEEPADRALSLFLKAVQTKTVPEYSIFDSLKLTRVIQQIEERVFRMY